MDNGRKLQGTQLSSDDIVRDFFDLLQTLRHSQAYYNKDEIDRAMESLRHSRHANLTFLDEIKWAVSQPDFQSLYEQYRIDVMGRHDSWREFQQFILSL